MKIERSKGQITVTEFDLDEDDFPYNLRTVGLELLQIDKDVAIFEIDNRVNWEAYKIDGIGQIEHGVFKEEEE